MDCPTPDKARFASRRAAKRALVRIGRTQGRMAAYRCGGHWHLGHSNAMDGGKWKPAPRRARRSWQP